MAHFAKIDDDGEVLQVIVVDNINNMNPDGTENENVGLAYLARNGFDGTWKQCSYRTRGGVHSGGGTPLRANYASPGYYYISTHNIFHSPRPTDKDGEACASWTLNTTTGVWAAPITRPTDPAKQDGVDQQTYKWDESVYQADTGSPKTLGWIPESV